MSDYVTKDSGKREEMPTGSVRDSREGKGRFELISPFALKRLAGVYERGAKKYADRNWEKGQAFSRFLDSALRHLNSFAQGMDDEDHLAQAAWNVFAIMHFQELSRDDLDDMPDYTPRAKPLFDYGPWLMSFTRGADWRDILRPGECSEQDRG